MAPKRHTNKLINETSPYLLQHAHNPVEWYPWGKEALDLARNQNKPIFLSIGYSSCHWCHVMERESFESDETAALMNQHYINIKVDREERPDLDHLYMTAVQMMTGHGGWPLSVFLTPDLKPFYGGTYFPPEDRHGLPSFSQILKGVATAWKDRKASVDENAKQLTEALKSASQPHGSALKPSLQLINASVQSLKNSFDPRNGGVGTAPKFFHVMDFKVALRRWKETQDPETLGMVAHTLDAWARGGIRDHLAGGFHRYSTDPEWLVPHFEKMLYDQSLVTDLFLEGYQATGEREFAAAAHHTLGFVLSDMQAPDGGFFSAWDADSEGVEGKYYVWTLEEIRKILPSDVSTVFERVFHVRAEGNWEHNSIFERKETWEVLARELDLTEEALEDTLGVARRKLLAERKHRTPPLCDDKILINWNGMMIDTLAKAAQILQDDRYYEAAKKAATFLLEKTWNPRNGILYHSFKERTGHEGFLDDYANLALGLLSLYETDFDTNWIKKAQELVDQAITSFYDPTQKLFYFAPVSAQGLLLRPIEAHDGATPSASALMTTALVRLYHFTDVARYREVAESVLATYQPSMEKIPGATNQFLIALDLLENSPVHFVIAKGDEDETYDEFLNKIRTTYLPQKTVMRVSSDFKTPHFTGRNAINGKTALYLCKGQTCLAPITTIEDLYKAINPPH